MPSAVDPAATLLDDEEDLERPSEIESAEASARATPDASAQPSHAPFHVTASEAAPPPQGAQPGRELANRYRLLKLLGKGGQGVVWIAEDTILGEHVALKWMRSSGGSSLRRSRREMTTLRMLGFPGVARLFDDGVEDGRPFLVMELASGQPFPGDVELCPGPPPRFSWAAIAGTTLALLEVLSRVHMAGVVHRDLKPANILVDAAGRPTVLDFGISLWHDPVAQGGAGFGLIVGTLPYLAPEQLLGGVVDARTDLYAVGVMLYEALTGRLPHEAPDETSLRRARLTPPLPVCELVPEVPALVGEVIDKLLSARAENRFRSASNVLAALRGDAHAAALDLRNAAPLAIVRAFLSSPQDASSEALSALGPLDEVSLRALFAGPDRLFHLREDAARLLWEHTGGEPSRILDEVTLWMQLGLARSDGAALVVDREALVRLRAGLLKRLASLSPMEAEGDPPLEEPLTPRIGKHRAAAASLRPGEEGRLFHLLVADEAREAAREAVELARRRVHEGDFNGATAALSEGLRAVREEGPQGGGAWVEEEEARILTEWAHMALAERTEYALARARYEVSRARCRRSRLARLEALLTATQKAVGTNAHEALKLADGIPPFEDAELERWRHWARVAAAVSLSSEEDVKDVLEEVEAWAARSGDRLSLLSLVEGRARLRYMQGRFEEAAALHREAAEMDPRLIGRISATLNAASSLLEAFRHREAAERAAEVRELLARCRHAYREGRAERVIRAAMYRMGEAGAPDLELVDAVARVGVRDLEGLVYLNEAAVAFRGGLLVTAADLAGRAERVWKELNWRGGPVLARSLALACGSAAEAGEVRRLSEEAAACRIPGIGIQVLGLLGRAFPKARRRWREAVPGLAETVPREHWGKRMDVLSVEEALAWAGGGDFVFDGRRKRRGRRG